MTYKITSEKANKTMVTKDQLKDAAWGNAYYGVDDCVVTEVVEQTQAELDLIERKSALLAEIQSLEQRIYYSQLDGATEFVASKMAQRATLKAELQGL
jgi:hypothetical protein